MTDWIQNVMKAASHKGQPLSAETLDTTSARTGYEIPEELRLFYTNANGATFLGGIHLDTLETVEQNSRLPIEGLPATHVWHLGSKDNAQLVFAVRKPELVEKSKQAAHTGWIQELPNDAWLFGLRRGPLDLKIYRRFEEFLLRWVPPVQTEEFGEVTYVRAMTAVQSALDSVPSSERPTPPMPQSDEPAEKPKKKSAPSKKAVRKTAKRVAKKVTKVAAKKRLKKVAKKPVARVAKKVQKKKVMSVKKRTSKIVKKAKRSKR